MAKSKPAKQEKKPENSIIGVKDKICHTQKGN
jgi:hypothetical protein